MATQQGSPQILHLFLGVGQIVVSGVLVVLRQQGVMSSAADTGGIMTGAFAGISTALIAIALVLKSYVPGLEPGQSTEQYWATPAIVAKITRVWFIAEGAGIMASIGYFETGAPFLLAAILAAIAVFWIVGPRAYAK